MKEDLHLSILSLPIACLKRSRASDHLLNKYEADWKSCKTLKTKALFGSIPWFFLKSLISA